MFQATAAAPRAKNCRLWLSERDGGDCTPDPQSSSSPCARQKLQTQTHARAPAPPATHQRANLLPGTRVCPVHPPPAVPWGLDHPTSLSAPGMRLGWPRLSLRAPVVAQERHLCSRASRSRGQGPAHTDHFQGCLECGGKAPPPVDTVSWWGPRCCSHLVLRGPSLRFTQTRNSCRETELDP